MFSNRVSEKNSFYGEHCHFIVGVWCVRGVRELFEQDKQGIFYSIQSKDNFHFVQNLREHFKRND
jgi:hypothetical protein